MQKYKSFAEFLLEQQINATLMNTESTTTSVTIGTPTLNHAYVDYYEILRVVLGAFCTIFSGISCYCLFKCVRNNCKCKVKFQFNCNKLYVQLLSSLLGGLWNIKITKSDIKKIKVGLVQAMLLITTGISGVSLVSFLFNDFLWKNRFFYIFE